MNRLERISAILIQLQSQSVITAQQIADRFDIGLRTVYRDIRTLEEAGVPIIGNVGVGYSLVDGYKLPPLMFTREEAVAFLTAEKFIENMTDSQNIKQYKSGMSKIRAVLKYVEKDYLTDIDSNIRVLHKGSSGTDLPADITQNILKSISERRIMHITYSAQEAESERDIEPIGCFYNRNFWYLIAFCKMRDDYRSFRIDRIQSFRLTDNMFSKEHPSLSDFMEKYRLREEWMDVVIRIRNSDMPIINDYKYYYGCIKEDTDTDPDYTHLHFRIFDADHFARWFISFADIARIIEPDGLKEKVRELYNKIKV